MEEHPMPKIIDVSYKTVRQRRAHPESWPAEDLFNAIAALLCMGVALYGLHVFLEKLVGL
jgi:hypothetical protein